MIPFIRNVLGLCNHEWEEAQYIKTTFRISVFYKCKKCKKIKLVIKPYNL